MRRPRKLTEFVRLDGPVVEWYEAEYQRQNLGSKSELYRKALTEYREGLRAAHLSQPELDWLEIYRHFSGLAGDLRTLDAIRVIASRAFVSSAVAEKVRLLAEELALPDAPAPQRSSGPGDPPRPLPGARRGRAGASKK